MENKLRLGKGGKLYYEDIEALGFPTAYHLYECFLELEDDLTLRDVFLYLKKDLDKWDNVLGNWCKEFVKESLTPYLVKEEDEEIRLDYLEVYRSVEVDKMDGEVNLIGINRLDFGGKGQYIKNSNGFKPGENIGIAVSFTSTNELAQYPIKIIREYEVIYHDYDKEYSGLDSVDPNPKKVYSITNMEVTLFDFLYAIFWELSFFGGPDKRDLEKKELMKRVEEVKKDQSSEQK
jgi:hypothetical protein